MCLHLNIDIYVTIITVSDDYAFVWHSLLMNRNGFVYIRLGFNILNFTLIVVDCKYFVLLTGFVSVLSRYYFRTFNCRNGLSKKRFLLFLQLEEQELLSFISGHTTVGWIEQKT